MSETTRILNAIEGGDLAMAGQLLPLVYDELRKLAAQKLAKEKPGQTLQGTALVHEAYLRLVGPADDQRWQNRGHFFAAAAEAMRRILVENARRKNRAKHGGGLRRVELNWECPAAEALPHDLLAVHEALDKLETVNARTAQLVKLHYFAGLTLEQAAAAIGVSERKAYTIWAYARAWLFRCLESDGAERV
jgi:RNA polymerase sigma factor (TIGR02999 family)